MHFGCTNNISPVCLWEKSICLGKIMFSVGKNMKNYQKYFLTINNLYYFGFLFNNYLCYTRMLSYRLIVLIYRLQNNTHSLVVKSNNDCYRNSWKSNSFMGSNKENLLLLLQYGKIYVLIKLNFFWIIGAPIIFSSTVLNIIDI